MAPMHLRAPVFKASRGGLLVGWGRHRRSSHNPGLRNTGAEGRSGARSVFGPFGKSGILRQSLLWVRKNISTLYCQRIGGSALEIDGLQVCAHNTAMLCSIQGEKSCTGVVFRFAFWRSVLAAKDNNCGRNSNTAADHFNPALGVVWHGLTSFSVCLGSVCTQPRPSLPTFRAKVFFFSTIGT